jgi:UDP-N-acetylmuramoyl-L-alanyl-D-glutamate--2,6-diaminopimelate ligase
MSAREHCLRDLVAGMADVPADISITDVVSDSRKARDGALFLALAGGAHHGAEFASQVAARGARAMLYEPPHEPAALPPSLFVAPVARLRELAGSIAARFFDDPSAALTVVGITGTNGKTTCAYLLAQALDRCGRRAAYAGTIGIGFPGALESATHTTLDSVELQRRLAQLRDQGAECVAMEVSSHALDQHRVAGVEFEIAAFTNLTRDHLDYHGSMESYGAAKARLFDMPGLSACVINIDDSFGAALAGRLDVAKLVATTRLRKPAQGRFVRAASVQALSDGLAIEVESSWGTALLRLPVIGDFNVDNVLTVLAILLSWDIPLARAVQALAQSHAPPGRMEIIAGSPGQPLAIVDYAHTPDALAKALRAARAHCRGKLHVVFGCGGERDRGKRAPMGRLAAQLADRITVTDDNPRGEAPQAIIADIEAGIPPATSYEIVHDRAAAIRAALLACDAGDVVLIAGKGHEDYQIYGAERRPFSDQSVVRAVLEGRGA